MPERSSYSTGLSTDYGAGYDFGLIYLVTDVTSSQENQAGTHQSSLPPTNNSKVRRALFGVERYAANVLPQSPFVAGQNAVGNGLDNSSGEEL